MKRVVVIETETYKNSLYKLKDPSIIVSIEKKVKKLLDNPYLAIPMMNQHSGICEIQVGKKYRVYCIKKEKAIILILLGMALHHKENYKKSGEYEKLFKQLGELNKEYGENYIEEVEDSIKKSFS